MSDTLAVLRFALKPGWGVRSQIQLTRARLKFCADLRRYRALVPPGMPQPEVSHLFPCLGDDTSETPLDVPYFYQDAWAFGLIAVARPTRHVDVGSHHKFVSLLSRIVPTTMVDLRPLPVPLDTLEFRAGTILNLPFGDGELPSVSSLCVVEHIGLGRYGDPMDPHGSEKAVAELKRVVAPGGDLYVSTQIDVSDRIYFNAHRAFTEETLRGWFAPFEVRESRYIFGSEFISAHRFDYGVGCYHLRRPAEGVA